MKLTISISALLLLFGLSGILQAAGEPITFKFDPPAGTTYVESSTKASTSSLPNAKTNVTDVATARTKIERDDKEVRYVTTIASRKTTQGGKAIENPLAALMEGLVLTNHISLAGKVTDVDGYDKLRAAIEKKMKKEQAEMMLKAFDQQLVLKEEQYNWQERVGRFIGRTAKIDERWIETADIALPTGKTIPVYRATLFSGWKTVQGQNLLRIIVKYDAEAAGLAKALGTSSRKVKSAVKRPLAAPKGFDYTRNDELLIDPATMLVYSETSDRKITVQVPAPGEKTSPFVVSERIEVRYKY